MRRTISIPPKDVVPSIDAVLKGQGIPEAVTPDETTTRLAGDSISIYQDLAEPTGIVMEISKADFERIYYGEGENDKETPLGKTYRSSDNLALFAVTVGESVSAKISGLFRENEFALGSMLDSAASLSAEMAAQALERFYAGYLKESGRFDSTVGVMQFSPGYCGWHMSGQKKLFQHLRPDEVGITLRESFLMQPLKSISGVIVVGAKEIFEFDDDFPFCGDCDTNSCRDRIEAVLNQ